MQVIVDKHTVTIVKNEIVNEGEYNVQSCDFQFSSDYDGLPKIAIFKTGNITKQIMLSGNSCITPEEVLQTTGIVGIGVYAYQTDGDNLILRYSPTPAVFTVEPGSYDEGDAPTPPTPSVVEQLQEEITQNANNITSLQDITSTHTTEIETLQAEQITQNNKIAQNTSDIATINRELTNYSLITETGSQIALNINSSNYQMTAILKDKNGNIIYTSNVIDLPIESMIVNVTYDSATKEIVFTLQNGTTLRVSVADLVSGLVSTDELTTILSNYYTKTEINTLLNGYVETTTYTQGQATQDTNIQGNADDIDTIESLIEQMPTVDGTGTSLSLQNTYDYKFINFQMNGKSTQDGTPVPSSQIPIKVVTGENSINICNENLFDKDTAINGEINGTDGSVSSSNTYITSEYIAVIPGQDYYLTGKNDGYSNCFYDINKNFIQTLQKTNGVITVPNDERIKYIRFNSNKTYKNTIMFVKGSTEPTTYVANQSQTYPLSLGNIELCTTPDGTLNDYIYGTPDNWYKKEYTAKIILNGTESWTKRSDGAFQVNVSGVVNRTVASSNYFNYDRSSETTGAFYTVDNYLRFFYNEIDTVDNFKTWLTTHNTIVYYPHATAVDVQITDSTLVAQLNNFYNNSHSYNGITNITSTYESGNEQIIINASALMRGGTSGTETDPVFRASAAYGITSSDITNWNGKQAALVSGTNIKTINNESLLGSGNITIQGGGTSYTAGTNIEITNADVINNTIPYESGTNYSIYGAKKSGTTVTGNGVAVGNNVTITGTGVSVLGNNATANGNSAVVIGGQARVSNVMGIAIGALAAINSDRGIAIGTQAETYNADAIAIGNYASGNESNVCIMGSSVYNINKLKLYTSSGKKELATQDYVDNAISTAITSALGGSY